MFESDAHVAARILETGTHGSKWPALLPGLFRPEERTSDKK